MHLPRVIQGFWLGAVMLCVGLAALALANPQDYPEFAAQKVEKTIPIDFISVEQVKQRLDAGASPLIIDVRSRSSYERAHLPGAMSLPLRELPQRFADVPRDRPVVLY
jgi:3-mercaptopyruvate sulfurtransferase SseA